MTVSRSDPSALRFLIGHELRSARLRAGVSQADAAKELGCTQPKINNMESGKYQQHPDEATKLMRLYGADVEQIDRIASLAGRADQSTWWAPFSEVLPNWFKTFVGLEGLASSQFTYQAMTLTGQLQTEGYAAALLSGGLQIAPLDLPQAIRARMARQRLVGSDPLRLQAVIEENTLDRLVGGVDVMAEQLQHLRDLMDRDNVDLRIMASSTAVHAGLDGDFTLLNFDEALSLGYIEYQTGALYVQDQAQVAMYKMIADRLLSLALSAEESARMIEGRIDRLQRA
ncbi:helix-turn-helix domain-containing protein [Nocardia cyriacigeorgica]|uniref:Helix-turn-helix domain-containing protein n=1 Tax=Nocardia cyriacigeorgica TaxID=135487 RepID=A0A5R8PHI3_9NOCA|nr:helix-turn-helix transcriptional regulator [Nocardia cyriacigeorgica]TLG13405.1 helix-turn-helix domain-containing protein [Nocardia cyriacigeorgica]